MATLLNYDPEKSLAWNKKAMEKKDDIIAVVDKICADGFSNIFFVGVGGTLTQAWSYEATLKPIASFPFYVEHAADFNTEGHKKFSKDSVLIVTSATGNTKEVVETVETAKKIGDLGCWRAQHPSGRAGRLLYSGLWGSDFLHDAAALCLQ